ncbi:hypothetical protein, partial [uncultured Maritalea sp.]|uniref:hypothetical protein n=1 Tax=uncultured Maritalea sp. TaxID=757249 RepID=UPI002609FD68
APRQLALLHDRIASPLYLLSLVLLAFAMSMQPRPLRSKRRINGDVVLLGTGVLVKVLGASAKQLAGGDANLILLIYLIPVLPLIPAFVIAWRNGAFSTIPADLRSVANV